MLDQMVPDIQKTSELVQEISASSKEQDSGAGQISRAIQQLDGVIQQNAGAAEEMASTSEELLGQAEQLKETVGFFRIGDSKAGSMRLIEAAANRSTVLSKIAHQASGMSPMRLAGDLHLEMAHHGNSDYLEGGFEKS